ncbi:MAG: PQQ-binding-like beta-propeller repeat protein [Methanomicrobiaceae archaeon]|nr:PQQ-binding-like beta-propeller repeat protein [Methanomicrobiaceae archaeon]
MTLISFKKIYLVFFALLMISALIPAAMCSSGADPAGPSYEWMKFFSPEDLEISSVWQLSDGSYVAGGKGEEGRVLFCLDSSGELLWTKNIPGGDKNGTVRFVEKSSNGGLYLFTDGENLIKTNTKGDVEWSYHQPLGAISSIEVSDSGDVLMSGNHLQSFITMVGSNGTELWNKTLGSPQGGGQYILTSVQKAEDGGFIIAGYINPIIYTGKYRGFVMKTDYNGNQEWASQYGYDNSAIITSISPLDNGGYAAGLVEITDLDVSMNTDRTGYKSYILVMDGKGEVLSKKAVPGVDIIHYIKSAGDGGYYLLASSYDVVSGLTDYMVIKTDSDGSVEWEKFFGQTRISSLQIADDGGLLLSGRDENSKDGIIIKMFPEDIKPEKSPGFGAIIMFSALFCVMNILNKKRRK